MILRPESPAHGGACIARDNGKVWLVNYALPGEVVEAEPRGRQGGVDVASALHVIEASPHRVRPKCPHFGTGASQPDFLTRCGGCQLQHVAYAEQLRQKRHVLFEQLNRARLDWPLERITVRGMDDPWRYRIRGEFHVLRRGTEVSLGFYRKHSYQTLPISSCLIHAQTIEDTLPAFAAALRHPAAQRVQALQLTCAPGTQDLLWSPYPPGSADPEFGSRAAATIPDLNLNDDSIGMEDDGRHFRVRPEAFVQVNARQRVVLYDQALSELDPRTGERIVDCYAGLGMLSARLAARAAEIVCLEESPYAVRLGEHNMRLNECGNVRYVKGRVEETIPAVPLPIDGLVLDPPRAGCAEAAAREIRSTSARRIVYVSCDPATLARDLVRLCEGGRYRLSGVTLVDMFPQTYHIESVVALQRA